MFPDSQINIGRLRLPLIPPCVFLDRQINLLLGSAVAAVVVVVASLLYELPLFGDDIGAVARPSSELLGFVDDIVAVARLLSELLVTIKKASPA